MQTPRFTDPARSKSSAWWLPIVLQVLLLYAWPLAPLWSSDPQYHYGWLVPFLAILLGVRRWTSRPAPDAPAQYAIVASCILLFTPLWFLLQPSPDWRLLNWSAAFVCVALLTGISATAGGRAWTRHFLFPAAFLLTAVPWPAALELATSQSLMRGAAVAASEVLSLLGSPALAEGNVVRISSGLLNVDLACSGIRSLQASLMIALAIGELFHLRIGRRALLVLGAAGIAIFTNAARIVFLGIIASAHGMRAIDAWHDHAGTLLLTICFALVWALGSLLSRGGSVPWRVTNPTPARPLPPALCIFALVWILCGILSAEWWFRGSEPAQAWKVIPPSQSQPIAIDAQSRAMLRFDEGNAWRWTTGNGASMDLYWLHWNAGPAHSRLLLNLHRPDVCLSAVGLRLLEDRGFVSLPISGQPTQFHGYTFDTGKGRLHVYYALQRNGALLLSTTESVRAACLRAVAEGRRTVEQELVQIAIHGCDSDEEADALASQASAQRISH